MTSISNYRPSNTSEDIILSTRAAIEIELLKNGEESLGTKSIEKFLDKLISQQGIYVTLLRDWKMSFSRTFNNSHKEGYKQIKNFTEVGLEMKLLEYSLRNPRSLRDEHLGIIRDFLLDFGDTLLSKSIEEAEIYRYINEAKTFSNRYPQINPNRGIRY